MKTPSTSSNLIDLMCLKHHVGYSEIRTVLADRDSAFVSLEEIGKFTIGGFAPNYR